MKSTRSSRLSPHIFVRALFVACVVLGFALLLGNEGCSSGAICYRNTDCPYASDCKQGTCVRRTASEAGGGSSIDLGAAGQTDASQTPDAN